MFKLIIKWVLGTHTIYDGSTCEISERLFEAHDYHKDKGGDDIPRHNYEYKCPKCGKSFTI